MTKKHLVLERIFLYSDIMKTFPTQVVISFRSFLFILIVFSGIPKGKGDHAVLFDESNYGGNTLTLGVNGGCYNLKPKWIGKVSSAQVHPDSCMIAWSNGDCSGQSIKLLPNTKETMSLRNVDFDKRIKSISLCTEISFRPTMDISDRMWNPTKQELNDQKRPNNDNTHLQGTQHGVRRQNVELSFYDQTNFKGSVLTLTTYGDCYNFKPKWINRISSLDSGGRCVMIWSSPNCKGVAATLPSDATDEFKDLGMIGFEKRIQSIRLCMTPTTAGENDPESNIDASSGKGDSENPSFDDSKIDTATDDEVREAALSEHNKLRKIHGVPDLKWDFKVQNIAQAHADWLAKNNKFEHSSNDDLGENIAGISSSSKLEALNQAIRLWYKEINNYDFNNPSISVLGIKAGHFTQLVWKDTTHIGLGVAWNPRRQWYVVVCNYSPPGNYKGNYEKNVFPPVQRKKRFIIQSH